MKNLLVPYLPALALLALSGCASTSGLVTSEDDGVYYSSSDHTTAVASTAPAGTNYDNGAYANRPPARAGTSEATNPDYVAGSPSAGSQDGYYNNGGRDQNPSNSSGGYYDDTSSPRYSHQSYNYYSPGVYSYAPAAYAPYTTLSYGYGWGGGFSPYGYAPMALYDPFYSPFYSPFGYGYGPGLSVGIGFGNPWGGYGFGNPWGGFYGSPYAYGAGFYSPYSYYHNSRFYGGYYGNGGYYGRNVIYTGSGNYNEGRTGRTVLVGPRGGRGGNVVNTGGRAAGTNQPGTVGTPNNGGRSQGGRAAYTDGGIISSPASTGGRATGGGTVVPVDANPGRVETIGGRTRGGRVAESQPRVPIAKRPGARRTHG